MPCLASIKVGVNSLLSNCEMCLLFARQDLTSLSDPPPTPKNSNLQAKEYCERNNQRHVKDHTQTNSRRLLNCLKVFENELRESFNCQYSSFIFPKAEMGRHYTTRWCNSKQSHNCLIKNFPRYWNNRHRPEVRQLATNTPDPFLKISEGLIFIPSGKKH